MSVFAAIALGACTLTHPLDKYGAGAADAGAGDVPDAADPLDGPGLAADGPVTPADATVDDAGCVGNPDILEPIPGEDVGPAIHLRVSAPTCITTMIVYLNYNDVLHVAGHTIDQYVSVPVGTSKLNVNGWAGTAVAHPSPIITFTRKN